MIAIEFSGFVYALLFIALCFLGSVWVGGEILRHLRGRRRRLQILTCPLCGLDFYDESPRSLINCPLCSSAVERGGKERPTV